MLIGFRLQNFRSFHHEQTLSYATSPDREHESTNCIRTGIKAIPRLSKSAVLFGANASGKTNVIAALQTMRELVLHSTGLRDVEFSERYTPFHFGPMPYLPTEFEIEVLIDEVRYRYTIAYNAQRITCERLLVYRTGKSQRWFERCTEPGSQEEIWAPFSPSFTGAREMWRKATRSTALFLTTAAQLNSEQLRPLFHWFEHCVEVVVRNDAGELPRVAAQLENPAFKSRALSLLRSADFSIVDIRVADRELTPGAQVSARERGTSPLIEFLHWPEGREPVWVNAAFEASGTYRLLALLGPLLTTIDQGKLLVIDSFGTWLHPLLARYFIQIINDPAVSSHCAQILFTSHNTTLMDLDILRRDEIWLVELDEEQSSTLSTVLRSRPRKHELIAKGYLRGRFGAVPKIRADLLKLAVQPAEHTLHLKDDGKATLGKNRAAH